MFWWAHVCLAFPKVSAWLMNVQGNLLATEETILLYSTLLASKSVERIMDFQILGAEQDIQKDLLSSYTLGIWVHCDFNSGNWCVCFLVYSR